MKDLDAIRNALKVLADNGINSLDMYASMVIANSTELDQGDILVNFPRAVDVVADWVLSVGEAHSDITRDWREDVAAGDMEEDDYREKPINDVIEGHVMPLMFDL